MRNGLSTPGEDSDNAYHSHDDHGHW